MTRTPFLLTALAALLAFGGCTVHHKSSASASASASYRAGGSGDARSESREPRERPEPAVRTPEDSSPRTAEPRERPPAKLVVVRRPPELGRRQPKQPEPEPAPQPEPEEEEPIFGSPVASDGTFEGNIYFLPENTQKLPDLTKLEPVGTVYATKLDIAPRSFDQGFPGISDRFEWFAIRYTARVVIDEGGKYGFRINSDDGAKLFIDGRLVIDNDGQHAPQSKSGKIDLEPGVHEFVIEYFQGPRYQIALQLFVTPPGGAEQIFSLE